MKRALLALMAALAGFGGTAAAASAQNLHVLGGPRPWLSKAEQQIAAQQSVVQPHWHTPGVRWTTNGWPVYIGTTNQIKRWGACGGGVCNDSSWLGYHTARVTWNGSKYIYHPYLVVNLTWTDSYLKNYPNIRSVVLDHETIETLVDPTGNRTIGPNPVEVCDPVYDNYYDPPNTVDFYNGSLSDFVFKSYFTNGSAPYDYLRLQKTSIRGMIAPYIQNGRAKVWP